MTGKRNGILVVDDTPAVLKVLADTLLAEGHTVRAASSGECALASIKMQLPEMILLDIRMPGMDGFEVCRRIKAQEESRDIPLLFISGAAAWEERVEGFALGAVDFIPKPFQRDELLARVRTHLELSRLRSRLEQRVSERTAELEAANAALIGSESRFRELVESAPLGIAISRDLRCVYANKAYAAMFGFANPEELAGGSMLDRVAPSCASEVEARARSREAGTPVATEYEMLAVRRDGSAFPVLASATRVHLADGPASLTFYLDITVRKQAEEALQEATRRKDAFLAMLGHELRNPLAPIRNASHLLKRIGAPDPRIGEVQRMIERQVMHLSRMVDDLLDVSRIVRGRITLHKEPLDFAQLVSTAIEDLQPDAKSRGIGVRFNVPAEPLWVQGDSTRLTQIVCNILQNALRFSDSGGQIDVRLQTADKQSVSLDIQDTGVGMTPETQARLFEPFAQADTDIARTRGGMGMGLALVQGLVKLHGGTVRARSDGLGRGSVFSVNLPLIAAPASPGTTQADRDAGAPHMAAKVLIVEDNFDAAESLRMFLSMLGYAVRIAPDGYTGLEEARRFRPAIVLCDIGLPGGMDGYAVARALRHDPALHAVCLIAMTGFGQDADKRRALESGFDVHMTKPVDPSELGRTLAALPASSAGAFQTVTAGGIPES